MELSSITPELNALKALAHPVRLRLLGLLRSEGPATATTLAHRLGMNTGATSYHLRQLALHGFIVDDAERGNARDRWWRAAHRSTTTDPADMRTQEELETFGAYQQAIAVVHTETLQRAVEERELLPEEWRSATDLSDWAIRLTPARARRLVDALVRVVDETEEDEPGADTGEFVVQLHAFPRPGSLADEPPS